jgi:hypothetical protein
MRLINNKPIREAEEAEERYNSPSAILDRQREEQRRRELERRELTLTIPNDWRIVGQVKPLTKAIWWKDEMNNRISFLMYAINHRNELQEVIVEPFELPKKPGTNNYNYIEVEYDKDTNDQLCREANKLGLTKIEYVMAILYTTALKINKERQAEIERQRAEAAEVTPLRIGSSFISQRLKRQLEAKYGKPSGFIIPNDTYTNMLIDLANEYFGLN